MKLINMLSMFKNKKGEEGSGLMNPLVYILATLILVTIIFFIIRGIITKF